MQVRNQADPIKVLLADDHTMFREGIASVLADYSSMEVVGQADNDEGAVELARLTRPDVILMQVQMPIPRAQENLRRMREVSDPAPKVVIVTMIEDPREIRELMELGASAYIVKSASTEHLVAAVRAAILDPKSKNAVVGMPLGMLEEAEEGSEGVLSARELEILLLASRGLSNHQIATKAHLAEGTVKRHLTNTYHKMGVGSRSEATRMALYEEWITIHDVVTDQMDGPEGKRQGKALPAAVPVRQSLGLLQYPEQVLEAGVAQLRGSPVQFDGGVDAVGLLEDQDAAYHAPANAGGSPASSASCTSTCGPKRSALPSRDQGGASSTSKSGRRRWMQSASASRYMRGEMVSSIRTKHAFVSADKDRMKGDTQRSSTR